jgi:transposase
MAKLIKLNQQHSHEEWRDMIRKIRNNEYKLKMLVIEKIMANPKVSGKYLQEIFMISKATLFKWVSQYNKGGLEGLKQDGRFITKVSGNKQIKDEVYEALKKEIDDNQEQVWTLNKMQQFIKEKFDIEPTIQAIYYRIKKTHSYKSSRPYPSKADRNKLGQFKKTL